MRGDVLSQADKMNLVNGAEVQDPAGVLSHGQRSVFIGWHIRLFQVVPLSRRTHLSYCPNAESAEYFTFILLNG